MIGVTHFASITCGAFSCTTVKMGVDCTPVLQISSSFQVFIIFPTIFPIKQAMVFPTNDME